MIGKISKSTNFSHPLNYLETKVLEGKGELIGTNMYGTSVKALTTEYEMISSLRRVRDSVFHASINLAPKENLSNDEFNALAKGYLDKMGFTEGYSQYRIYRHYDHADREHIHILANRVLCNNTVVSAANDFRKSENLMRSFEKEYGLSAVINSKESKTKQLSKGEIELFNKTGVPPIKLQLAYIIEEGLKGKPTINQFIEHLNSNGTNVIFHHNASKIFGCSFELEGFKIKGSGIGKGYTWGKLSEKIDYEHKRDFKQICSAGNYGAKINPRGASAETSGYQYIKYSAANSNNATINSGANFSSNDTKIRGGKYPGTTNDHNGNQQNVNEYYSGENGKSGEAQNTEQNIQFKTIQSSFFGGNNIQLGSVGSNSSYDENDLKKKRKKKTPNRRPRL